MKTKFSLMWLALIVALFAGCGDSDPNVVSGLQGNNPIVLPTPTPDPDPTPEPDPVTSLRIVNSFSAADNLTVTVDGAVVDNDLDSYQATPYMELEPGQHTIVVNGSIPFQTDDTVINETVTLTEGSSSSFVFAYSEARRQSADFTGFLLLTDNVTPVTGQVNARLVNLLLGFENNANVLDDDDNTLLGPVREGNVSSYSTIANSVFTTTDSLIGFLTEPGGPGEESYLFDSVEGSTDTLVEALAAQLGVSGVNLTLVFSENRVDETLALLVLLDDLENGSTTILSFGEGEVE